MEKHILRPMDFSPENLFTALSHPLRLRVMLLLHGEGELCVCELIHALDVSQPMISRHLAHLRQWGLVNDRRQGLWVYYRLHDEFPAWAEQVLAASITGIGKAMPFAGDREALAAMPDRPGAACCA